MTEKEPIVDIHDLSAEGAGVGRLPDGRTVFVHRTAPGDRVRIAVTLAKKSWARGRLVELLEGSDARTSPPCPLYDRCGGCTLQHLEGAAQIAAKSGRIGAALRRIGAIETEDPPVQPSTDPFHYRNRIRVTLRRLRGGRVVAGFHALHDPDRIVEIEDHCLLPEAPVATVWAGLRREWGAGAGRLPPGRELQLTLQRVRGGVALLIDGGSRRARPHDEPPHPPGTSTAPRLVDRISGLSSVWHRTDPGAGYRRIEGESGYAFEWDDQVIEAQPGAFLQVNEGVARAVQRKVFEWVGSPGGRRLLDGYCGMGLYGAPLAAGGDTVVGIELDPAAVGTARALAPEGFQVLEGRVEDRIAEALPVDIAILNPPRSGLGEEVSEALVSSGVERIVYVSCDPATLARDVARLQGYRVTRVEGFDMFPQTAHVETVVELMRDEPATEVGSGPENGEAVAT